MQGFGSYVGAVGPADGPKLPIELDTGEVVRIVEGLEDAAPRPSRCVDLAAGTVVGAWLRDHSLREHAARLRFRAEMEGFDVHPSELGRILERPDVLATGISAGDGVGLVGRASSVEVYAPASRRRAIVDEHALVAGAGPVRVRWVPDGVWGLLDGDGDRRAPRAAVLLDLLESDEPRARREAARALGS